MPHLVTAAGVAELALQKIGAFSSDMDAPDTDDMSRALVWLSVMLDELTAVEKPWWAVPTSQTFNLVAGRSEYELSTLISPRLQMIRRAYLVTDGKDAPLTLVDRLDYEALDDKASAGGIEKVYITREDSPVLRTWRVPATGTTEKIKLYGVGFSRDATDRNGNVDHEYPAAWQLYMINRLAWTLGDGPIRNLPATKLEQWKAGLVDTLIKLNARTNAENLDVPDLVQPDPLGH